MSYRVFLCPDDAQAGWIGPFSTIEKAIASGKKSGHLFRVWDDNTGKTVHSFDPEETEPRNAHPSELHKGGFHRADDLAKKTISKSLLPGQADHVNHPPHYTAHPSGIECIQVTEYMNFNLGNAVKYIWRAGLKNDNPIQDLEKARWYIERELSRLSRKQDKP